jgi:hypothetical protein
MLAELALLSENGDASRSNSVSTHKKSVGAKDKSRLLVPGQAGRAGGEAKSRTHSNASSRKGQRKNKSVDLLKKVISAPVESMTLEELRNARGSDDALLPKRSASKSEDQSGEYHIFPQSANPPKRDAEATAGLVEARPIAFKKVEPVETLSLGTRVRLKAERTSTDQLRPPPPPPPEPVAPQPCVCDRLCSCLSHAPAKPQVTTVSSVNDAQPSVCVDVVMPPVSYASRPSDSERAPRRAPFPWRPADSAP